MHDTSSCQQTVAALADGSIPDSLHVLACKRCAALVGGVRAVDVTPTVPFSLPSAAVLVARNRARNVRRVGASVAIAAVVMLAFFRAGPAQSPNAEVEPDLLALADVSTVTADDGAANGDDAYGGDTLALLDPFAEDDLFAADDLDLTPVPDSTFNQGDL